jgi:hypothetical protein
VTQGRRQRDRVDAIAVIGTVVVGDSGSIAAAVAAGSANTTQANAANLNTGRIRSS